ncbi:helix-turn-helix domain-containing protein [Microbacterium sp. NPDC064584]|uniref:helix-turn-helix domain-containing protein n=1 Tax=Microbacterium sp. NPDC064584 TaxID=3155817 RepID=UPI00343D5AEA
MTTSEAATRPRFYFISEVATEMRRSEAAVRWLIHSGALKSSKLAGRRIVTAEQLEEFFATAVEG